MTNEGSSRGSQWKGTDYIPLLTQDELNEEPRYSDELTLPLSDEELNSSDEKTYLQEPLSPTRIVLQKALSYLVAFLRALIPSYVYLFSKKGERKLRSTSGLDGLRGLAALFVTASHYLSLFTRPNDGWIPGVKETEKVWNLPIIRFFYTGPSMVFIFFVISGYVLSLKSVKHTRQRDWGALLSTLSSTTFRRGIRLYGPSVAILVILCLLAKMGFFMPARSNSKILNMDLRFLPEPKPWGEQLLHLFYAVLDFVNVWKQPGRLMEDMDSSLWTIRVEFKGSLVLFMLILGTCKLKPGLLRKAILGACLAHQVFYQQWDTVLFFCGFLLADFDTPHTIIKEPEAPVKQTTKQHIFWVFVILTGMWFCSSPTKEPHRSWGYVWITPIARFLYYSEPNRFWPSVGSVILVCAANRSDLFKRFLNTRIVQYLGDVSFSIYLIHFPFLRAFAFWFISEVVKLTHPGGFWGWFLIDIAYLLSLVLIFTLGDLVWRYIDVPCVNFARWLETQVVLKDGE